jgi:hypothetical protein
MKRIFLFLISLTALANYASAQIEKDALGLRFGAGYGLGTEISYQYRLTSVNRIEFDFELNGNHEYIYNSQNNLSFQNNYSSLALIGLYHWVWKLNDNINWYAGPGAKLGIWNSMIYQSSYRNGLFLSAAGDIGIEYSFPARIQLAVNARPELGIFNYGTGINVGFAIRYQF